MVKEAKREPDEPPVVGSVTEEGAVVEWVRGPDGQPVRVEKTGGGG